MGSALSGMLFLALHITSWGSFPKPLTEEEEKDCIKRLRDGDPAAKKQLIEHNLRLVAHIVKKYYAVSGEQDDLISIGTIGLIKAASTFDCGKSIRFATYASRCIENEILMHFRQKRRGSHDLYIDDPIDTDHEGNSLTLLDVMSADDDMLGRIELQEREKKLRLLIQTELDGREQRIIKLRYGLDGSRPLTQREASKLLGISRSYVSRLEKHAMGILREGMGEG